MGETKRTILKRGFGPHISEGQRLLWVALVERDCTQKELGELVGAPSGLMNRWLFAEGKPGSKFIVPLLDSLGIGVRSWTSPPAGDFPLEDLQRFLADALASTDKVAC